MTEIAHFLDIYRDLDRDKEVHCNGRDGVEVALRTLVNSRCVDGTAAMTR